MKGVLRLSAMAFVASAVLACAAPAAVSAASAIRNEPGDPYNPPIRLPRPNMICAVGQEPARLICPARLAAPLTLCRCYGTQEVGLRYFVYEPRRRPSVFSFDGYAW